MDDEEIEEHEIEEEKLEVPEEEGEALEKVEETPSPSEPLTSFEEIPITLDVELGSFQMSVEKLLSLSPGNLLELKRHPNSPVNLVVNGKIIGKGELMMMGDQIGIQILELGKL